MRKLLKFKNSFTKKFSKGEKNRVKIELKQKRSRGRALEKEIRNKESLHLV
jgi:hypothetical protein